MKTTSRALAGLLACTVLSACDAPAPEASTAAEASSAATGEPAVAEPASPAPANAEVDIRHFLLQEYSDAGKISYALGWKDLDGDGADEAIVSLGGPYFCGSGGCNLLILTPAGPMWRKVGDVSVTRTPVAVLDTASNGWKDVTVAVAGGGGPSGTVILKFDGETYPGNASMETFAPEGTTGSEVIPEAPEYATVEAQPQPAG